MLFAVVGLLLVGGSAHLYAVTFDLACLVLQVFLPHATCVRWLKWLTVALLSYVAVAFSLRFGGWHVAGSIVHPQLPAGNDPWAKRGRIAP